jgi:hypothetical protein
MNKKYTVVDTVSGSVAELDEVLNKYHGQEYKIHTIFQREIVKHSEATGSNYEVYQYRVIFERI